MKNEISVTRRATYKTEEAVSDLEREKRQQVRRLLILRRLDVISMRLFGYRWGWARLGAGVWGLGARLIGYRWGWQPRLVDNGKCRQAWVAIQDTYIDELNEYIKKQQEQLALYEAQLISQKDETKSAHETLQEAA